jgi:hypothetical protein
MKVKFRRFKRPMFDMNLDAHLQLVADFATKCDEFLISIHVEPNGDAIVWYWE